VSSAYLNVFRQKRGSVSFSVQAEAGGQGVNSEGEGSPVHHSPQKLDHSIDMWVVNSSDWV